LLISDDGIEREVINGLHFYFNKCVGTRLLYKKERKQYRVTRLKYEHLDNSQIFGAEHLLRLFGKDFLIQSHILYYYLSKLILFYS
jgi:hypothetical protein